MCPYKRLLNCLMAAVLLPLLSMPAFAEEEHEAEREMAYISVVDDESSVDAEEAFIEEIPADTTERILIGGAAGYRFMDVSGYPGRVGKYDYLHSSPYLSGHYNRLARDLKYSLEGNYLNEKDYYGDFLMDYQGDYRLHVRMESLFHNLPRHELFPSTFYSIAILPDPNAPQVAAYEAFPDTPTDYGIRVEQDTAAFRYKLHDFPLHVNLEYWRLHREGTRQVIFADHAFEGDRNRFRALRRDINNQTLEGTVGLDAHLGPLDLIYSFKLRQFHNDAGIPTEQFLDRPGMRLGADVGLGMQYGEEPESRFYTHTVKLHTSLAGGVVGAASYSIGKRDNRSDLTDIGGVGSTSSTLHNVATDFSYTPCRQFSLAVKYRLQDVDNDNASRITSRFDIPGIIDTRRSIDVKKSIITATASLRPVHYISFIGEYKGTFTEREDLSGGAAGFSWHNLPSNTATNKGSFSVIAKPLQGMRLKALYSYSATDSPSYGASSSDRHEGKFLASYNSSNRWGFTAHLVATAEENDQIHHSQIDFSTFARVPYSRTLGREKRDTKVSTSLWITPLKALSVTGSYAFLRSAIDQGVLLNSSSETVHTAADFISEAHVFSLDSIYRLTERWDLALFLQQVRSSSRFAPSFQEISSGGTVVGDTAGISDYSRIRTVENTVSARSEYRFTDNFSGTLEYNFREYRDKMMASYTGTVETYTVLLNAKW